MWRILGLALGFLCAWPLTAEAQETIRVGLIFSERGATMTNERPLRAATLAAIDQVNLQGGVNGRRLEPIVRDGASDPAVAARHAADLLENEAVAALFACWTSACRKAVVAVVEERNGLLFYPVQYEGTGFGQPPRDPSPRVIYSGAAPNQQLTPAVHWVLRQKPGARIALIGSDYVFPRSANAQIAQLVAALGGSIVMERYEPLGRADFSSLGRALEAARPDVIFNTVNGIDNSTLFESLSRLDPTGERYLTISFSVEETQIREIGAGRFVNRLAAWNYFHDANNTLTRDFLPTFRRYLESEDAVTSDPVEAAYLQVMIFAQAARRARSAEPNDVLAAARGLPLVGFRGSVRVDPDNRHLWKPAEIRRFGQFRTFEPLWASGYPLPPDPAPSLEAARGLVVEPPADARRAAMLLGAQQPNASLQALLYFTDSTAVPDTRAIAASLNPARLWSEQYLALRLLLRTRNGQDIVASTLARQAALDANFTLFVLNEVALMAPEAELSPALVRTMQDILRRPGDPLVAEAAVRALVSRALVRDGEIDAIFDALQRNTDAFVAITALKGLERAPRVSTRTLAALRVLFANTALQQAPQFNLAGCRALAQIAQRFERQRDSSRAHALREALAALRREASIDCEEAAASVRRLEETSLARTIASRLPRSLEGWLVFFAAAFALWKTVETATVLARPAWAIRHLRPFKAIDLKHFPQAVAAIVGRFATARWAAARPAALDAWISANRAALAACARPGGQELPYQPLFVRETIDGERPRPILPNSQYFDALLQSPRCRGAILGEGGVGKSTFALELLRRASAPQTSGPASIGVFLRAADVENLEDLAVVLASVSARLSNALRQARQARSTEKMETQDEAFVRELLRSGRILLVIDDLPRFVEDRWKLAASPEFNELFERIFYTGRTDVADLGRRIEPLPIDKTTLLNFVDTSFAISGENLPTPGERYDLTEALDTLFHARNAVPALFGAVVAQQFLDARKSGAPLAPGGLSMPQLVVELVRQRIEAAPREALIGIDTSLYWRPAGAIAWLCLANGLQVAPISLTAAREALAPYGDSDALVELLCDHTQLAHLVGAERIVIASDALAEYLSALWIFDADASRWAMARQRIETVIAQRGGRRLPAPTGTFLSALLDVAERALGGAHTSEIVAPVAAPRVIASWLAEARTDQGEIRVGVLFSQTGEMAISERPLIEATLLAIEQVNARGGVSSRRISPIVVDGGSDPSTFAAGARSLMEQKVAVIFGCWTSASRIEVLRVLSETDGLLFYPVQYEGYEADPHAIYFGAAPNQQILPAIDWCVTKKGARKFLLLGSDYVFPRIAHEIMRADLERRSDIVQPKAPFYVPLNGPWNFDAVLTDIEKDPPDFILNTINGLANLEFFWRIWELKQKDPARFGHVRVLSFSLGDYEVQRIGAEITAGHFASWTYFAALDEPANASFLRAMRSQRGVFFPSDPAEAAYVQVMAFAQAARPLLDENQPLTASSLRTAALGLEVQAPSGPLKIDPRNGHVFKTPRIGELDADGVFRVVWSDDAPRAPDPYPFPELTETIAAIRAEHHDATRHAAARGGA